MFLLSKLAFSSISLENHTLYLSGFETLTNEDFADLISQTKTVIISDTLQIGTRCFYQWDKIEEIEIDEGLTTISGWSFAYCSSLTTIKLPSSLSRIDDSVFRACYKLSSIVIPEENEHFVVQNGVLFSKDITNLIFFPYTLGITSYEAPDTLLKVHYGAFSLATIKEVTFHEGLKEIGVSAFAFSTIEVVNIPSSLEYLRGTAFFQCKKLKHINLPSSLKKIEGSTFSDCSDLQDFILPSSLEEIGNEAFSGCQNAFVSLDLPDSLEKIGDGSFIGCTKIENIIISKNHSFFALVNGILFDKKLESLIFVNPKLEFANGIFEFPNTTIDVRSGAFAYNTNITSLELSDTLTSILKSTFYQCTGLKRIKLSSSIELIEDNAFSGCSSLESINFPDRLVSIGQYSFQACKSLSSLIFPDTLVSIGSFAFYDCTNVKKLVLSRSLREIGSCGFRNCISLETIEIPEENEYFVVENGILLSASKDVLVLFPMAKEMNTTTFKVPDTVKTLYPGCLAHISTFSTIILPEGLKVIRDRSLIYSKMKTLFIPSSVTSIEEYSISSCSNLKHIYFMGKKAPNVHSTVFSGSSLAKLCVKEGFQGDTFGALNVSWDCPLFNPTLVFSSFKKKRLPLFYAIVIL